MAPSAEPDSAEIAFGVIDDYQGTGADADACQRLPAAGDVMDTLGLSLVVGGLAFLISGLIFLLPTGRKDSSRRAAIDENLEDVDRHLREMRRGRGDLS